MIDFIWHPMSVIIPYGFCHQVFSIVPNTWNVGLSAGRVRLLGKNRRNNPCDHKRREMYSPFPHSMPYLPSFQCGCAHRGVVAWIRYHPLPIPMPTLYWYWQPASWFLTAVATVMLSLVAASMEDHKNGIGTATSLPQRRDVGTSQNWGPLVHPDYFVVLTERA